MRLALGPIQYFWDRATVFEFYARVGEWDAVDIVYLGETVCSKRRQLRPEDWLALAARLEAAGKEVVLSTLALIEAESELASLRRLVHNGRYAIEANDMAAVRLAARAGVPFVAGAHLNVYNSDTLALLAELGARRFVLPFELGREELAALEAQKPAGLETEVFVFGRLPLALSARCFTARAHGVGKDDCGFRCGDYPEGLLLRTQEHVPFLVVNGVQLQSAPTYHLLAEVPELGALGVEVLRLSPQRAGMEEILAAYRAALEGRSPPPPQQLAPYLPEGTCCGYWHARPGLDGQP